MNDTIIKQNENQKEKQNETEVKKHAERLRELNKLLLSDDEKPDMISVDIMYKGETREIKVPREAIQLVIDKGEIPNPVEAMNAITTLEKAKRMIEDKWADVDEFDPLEVTAYRIFDDAENVHMLNIIYAQDNETREISIRDNFIQEFNLKEVDPILRRLVAKMVNKHPDEIQSNRMDSVYHETGMRIINLAGLGIGSDNYKGDVIRLTRDSKGSHIEWRYERTNINTEVISISTKHGFKLIENYGRIHDIFVEAISHVPKATIKKYGQKVVEKSLATYVNAEYLGYFGKKLEMGD
ncbi:hypothetical protein J7J26_00490 [Candidatus Micrarchaeota archaeon]|nr:hypothetical protein [Candidatus Micrarchaeota archaeon]